MIPPIDEPGGGPTFPSVEWDDATDSPPYTDGTAYLQVLEKNAEGQWQGTNSFLLLCNYDSATPGNSHYILAGTKEERGASYVLQESPYDSSADPFKGLEGFRVWFFSPDRGNIWLSFDWCLNANMPNPNITSIQIKHTDPQNPQGQDQDMIELVDVKNAAGSVMNQGSVHPNAGVPTGTQPPAPGSSVTLP
ncbi:MAG: hypothetical protein QNJ98_18045 [Planctomycetota bacterium]|nr:hypothetical protein [Planctomycetota bacterium]